MSPDQSKPPGTQRLPLTLKILFPGLVVLWAIVYWNTHGPQNFLWFCDLANLVIAYGVVIESPLILSSQAVSVLLVQALWMIDVLGRSLAGIHLIGGTEYMFNPAIPLPLRLLSLYHVVVPVVLVWVMLRLGYDRRGWLLQTGVAWVVLPLSLWLTEPARDINWVHGLFGRPQSLVAPPIYFAALMIGYPVVLYFPTHLVLRRLFPEPDER